MKKKSNSAKLPSLRPRFRIACRNEIGFGPGKADLLELIAETGSISEAASRMGMSYMKAWSLIHTMKKCFQRPLVETARGGHKRGGAKLTEEGRRALQLYRRMEKDSLEAVLADWQAFRKLLRN